MKMNFKKFGRDVWRDRQLYLFLLLPVVYIIIFAYIPMGGLVIAFEDYSVRKGLLGSDWVGLEQFVRFFNSYQFWRVLRNTVVLSLYSMIAGFPFPIIFALMVNCLRDGKYKKFSESVVKLPYFISTTVLVGILFQILGSRTGLYGTAYEAVTGFYPTDLFSIPKAFRHLHVWSGVWKNFGWNSIIYTAALSAVNAEYHEAAQLDGASRFQRALYIDLPSICPTIIVTFILNTGSIMSVGFEKAFLMQNGMNSEYSEIISTYLYKVGLSAGNSDFSYATAIGLFNSVVNLFIIMAVNRIARKVGETSLW